MNLEAATPLVTNEIKSLLETKWIFGDWLYLLILSVQGLLYWLLLCHFVNVKQRFIRQFQTRKIHHFPVQEHYKTCNQCLLETKIGQNQAIQPSFWIHDTEHRGVAIKIWFGIHLIECRLQSLSDIETKNVNWRKHRCRISTLICVKESAVRHLLSQLLLSGLSESRRRENRVKKGQST